MTDQTRPTDSTAEEASMSVFQSAIAQLERDCLLYNQALGSYNTHLDNHRERQQLHGLPYRQPISAHVAFRGALAGERQDLEALLSHLLDQAHLDSHLRRHPRVYPVHLEAVEHLQHAREQLVHTIEEAICHLRDAETTAAS